MLSVALLYLCEGENLNGKVNSQYLRGRPWSRAHIRSVSLRFVSEPMRSHRVEVPLYTPATIFLQISI